MREHQNNSARRAENAGAGDPKKDVTHVHDTRVTEHPIEPLLRDGNQPDVNDVS